MTFTGLAGIGFAYFVTRRWDQPLARRFLVAGGLLLVAMAAHFIWNSPWLDDLPILLYGAFKGLPFLIGLIVLLYLARRRENAALGEILASEVGQPGLATPELDALRDRRSRRAAGKRIRAAAGPEAERTFKQLQREQVKLALVASSVDTPDDAQLLQQRSVCESLRFRLWQTPGVPAALGVSPEAAAEALQRVSSFTPDRQVGPTGAWAWARPDQSERRRVGLQPGLQLDVVEARLDGWVLVRSESGWYGWTGAPYLTELAGRER